VAELLTGVYLSSSYYWWCKRGTKRLCLLMITVISP